MPPVASGFFGRCDFKPPHSRDNCPHKGRILCSIQHTTPAPSPHGQPNATNSATMSAVTTSSVPLLAGLATALLSGSLLVATADTGAARYLLTTGISMGVGAVSLVLLDRPLPAPARMASLLA